MANASTADALCSPCSSLRMLRCACAKHSIRFHICAFSTFGNPINAPPSRASLAANMHANKCASIVFTSTDCATSTSFAITCFITLTGLAIAFCSHVAKMSEPVINLVGSSTESTSCGDLALHAFRFQVLWNQQLAEKLITGSQWPGSSDIPSELGRHFDHSLR